ncbi:hypothetical protein DFH09DRAFT_1311102 [Mycena vulgaris]|nr:hypothetical protein DFH09DRAFT_1311102 [Mycena vulgaris]
MIREASDAGGRGVGSGGGDPRGVSTDLGTMGLDMRFGGNFYSTFITPRAERRTRSSTTFTSRSATWACTRCCSGRLSDENLFFMLYASARLETLSKIPAS